MSITKKLVSGALMAATTLSLSGALFLVPVANAQSTASLQAQIAALLAQIQQLHGQLSSNSGSSSACSFSRDLTPGKKGADVSCLQGVLISKDYLNASATGFYGQLTKAAVAKWQAAAGVSPASGIFGPKSRAAFAAMSSGSTGGSTSGSGGSTGGYTGGSGSVVLPAPASGLAVSLASDSPAAGSLISSSGSAAARVPVLAVNFTAGNASGVTVSDLKFHKTGVLSDSSVSGAYLVENGKVVAQYTSISSGVIDFSGLQLNVAAGQTRKIWLAIDPAAGLSAGNTVGFAMNAASNVSGMDANNAAVAASGNFPLNGNIFTVTSVSNPSIASLTVASSSVANSITAGTTNNIVGAWNFTVQNSKVWLKGINFKVIGSANKTDIRNVRLMVNGTQVGQTLASVAADGSAYFDTSANPGTLNTGSNNLQIYADVLGSPSYNFQFEVLNSYDIYAVDSQYNVPIAAQSNVGTQVSILSGSVTVTLASDTPTGNIAKGQSGITLAKFNVYAAGEAVKIKFLDFSINFVGQNATSTASGLVKNVSLVDDAGSQVGTTINNPPTSNTCAVAGGSYSSTTGVYADCFGTSGSPINYIVPANTTRVLSLKGDIQSTASFTSLVAKLAGNTSNLQGLTSSQSASSASVGGSSLSLSSSQLTVTKNTSVGTQTFAAGSRGVKIGSYAFTAAAAEGVTVNSLTLSTDASNGSELANLLVKVGSQQLGQTQGVISNNGSYSFAGTFTVPAGQTTFVDVYADVLSSAASNIATATTLTGFSGSGAVSFTAVSLASNVPGQPVNVSGQATIQASLDSSSPSAGQLVMGSSQNSLASFRFTETSNVENVKITDMTVTDSVASTTTVAPAFGNVTLYSGSTPVGTAGSAVTGSNKYTYVFHFANAIVVPQANSLSLALKGDVASYSSSGATDNTAHTFKINATGDLTALGATSNATSAVTLATGAAAPTANAQTVLRSTANVAVAALGTTSGRSKQAIDDLGTLAFTANAAGSVSLNTVTVTFSGTAPSAAAFLAGVDLRDANGNSVMSTTGVASSTSAACTGANTCSKSWSFGTVANGWQISSQGYTFKLRSNTQSTFVAGTGVSAGLSATVNANTDVVYYDALDSNGSSVSPPSNAMPLQIISTSFISGT